MSMSQEGLLENGETAEDHIGRVCQCCRYPWGYVKYLPLMDVFDRVCCEDKDVWRED